MSFLGDLKESGKLTNVFFHKIQTTKNTGKVDFYAVFEGNDDEKFYSKFIKDKMPEAEFYPLICKGKDGVLKLQKKVIDHYGKPENVFYFVDADYDRFFEKNNYPEQTFCTCGYSIENYFYKLSALFKAIRKHFDLNRNENLNIKIKECLEQDCLIFEKRIKIITIYIIALRLNGKLPNLKKLHFEKIFEYNNGLQPKKMKCQEIFDLIGVEQLKRNQYLKCYKTLKNEDICKMIRGKFIT